MIESEIILPSKPKIVKDEEFSGVYEIDGLYPGYGHTLGNSLRRIILSSLPGSAITSAKIENAPHEFSTIEGIKEDTITILLNLQKVNFRVTGEEAQQLTLDVSGKKEVTAADLKIPGQVEVMNPEQPIATLTDKSSKLEASMQVEKGLGYIPKETLQKEKVDIGTIVTDVSFTPIRRVNYEVENMRVGDRTDHNRLRITIETDGTITPRQALESSIETMIRQLQAVVGFREEVPEDAGESDDVEEADSEKVDAEKSEEKADPAKVKVEDLELSTRTANALSEGGVRTVAGLAKKKEEDLLALEGIGDKGVMEIRKALGEFGLVLKQNS